jgi:hypothetical protein
LNYFWGEKFMFQSSNILNVLSLPALNPKSTTFAPLTLEQSPQDIEKRFFGVFVPVQIPYFWKKFFKHFLAAFGTWF